MSVDESEEIAARTQVRSMRSLRQLHLSLDDWADVRGACLKLKARSGTGGTHMDRSRLWGGAIRRAFISSRLTHGRCMLSLHEFDAASGDTKLLVALGKKTAAPGVDRIVDCAVRRFLQRVGSKISLPSRSRVPV
mmetsp:Transcript_28305/g.39357  ORF Transcript_28305/g.39357 Transcript_28305/m.39357 type:complete len:135 (+) Transcript_28305:39-443(+)|eukprot:CAMPEP_0184477888 /NCGR_PEP_ID=MMETSP0113_2-20130426/18_1 /TAXON_ID=91329 /ORGANISM="Norrisiella sphaerica, Strain BC52" /LENGTH=134 /DNA_ID=CAMNT_0026855487 /DNA_START=29 /DNA_END=433 /DNA_ORIENTATION=-